MTAHDKDSIRTPLAKARGMGSAKSGVHHWWMQRVSAVAIVPLALYLLTQLPLMTTNNYVTFITWVADPLHAVMLIAFIAAAFYHGALGLQVIIEDYVHCEAIKLSALIANKLGFLFLGLACVWAVISLNFGFYR